jgi:GTP-binding protein EngB required for normal cell division
MKQPEINTMILGQTGVGKSSLINYLYGADVVLAGSGKPVTGRGDFTKISVPSPFKSDVKINIFDSWGLESDKAEDWASVIDAKLNAELSFDEMIYAIVYCSSYANDRIQDFEIRMLKKLLSKQYKVTIALTNADNSGFETKKTIFREKFAKELAEYRGDYSVIDICAQAKPKLGQSAALARTFGNEELFQELEKDFSANFWHIVYIRWTEWKDDSLAKLRDFKKYARSKVLAFDGKFFDSIDKRAQRIRDEISAELQSLVDEIQKKIKHSTEEMKEWYEKTAGAFFKSRSFTVLDGKEVNFDSLSIGNNDSWFDGLIDKFRSGHRKEQQDELMGRLDEAVGGAEDKIRENYRVIENFHEDLKRSQRGKNI